MKIILKLRERCLQCFVCERRYRRERDFGRRPRRFGGKAATAAPASRKNSVSVAMISERVAIRELLYLTPRREETNTTSTTMSLPTLLLVSSDSSIISRGFSSDYTSPRRIIFHGQRILSARAPANNSPEKSKSIPCKYSLHPHRFYSGTDPP